MRATRLRSYVTPAAQTSWRSSGASRCGAAASAGAAMMAEAFSVGAPARRSSSARAGCGSWSSEARKPPLVPASLATISMRSSTRTPQAGPVASAQRASSTLAMVTSGAGAPSYRLRQEATHGGIEGRRRLEVGQMTGATQHDRTRAGNGPGHEVVDLQTRIVAVPDDQQRRHPELRQPRLELVDARALRQHLARGVGDAARAVGHQAGADEPLRRRPLTAVRREQRTGHGHVGEG